MNPQTLNSVTNRVRSDSIKKGDIKRKRPRKSKVQADPTRSEVTDSRRTYSQLLLNAFNSCDLEKLIKTFKTFCAPDLFSTCTYEGINNPYASNYTELRTINNHIAMWSALIKSAPDFLFKGEFIEAYISNVSSDKRCIVRSKFTFSATRIVDIKVASEVNEEVILRKLNNKNEFPTTENELMAQIHKQLSESYHDTDEGSGGAYHHDDGEGAGDDLDYRSDLEGCALEEEPSFMNLPPLADVSLTSAMNFVTSCTLEKLDRVDTSTSIGTSCSDKPTYLHPVPTTASLAEVQADSSGTTESVFIKKEVVKSLFDECEHKYLQPGVKIYAEGRRLPESILIRCSGTFTVWVNEDNKIDEYAFLYTAMDEEKREESQMMV